MIQTQVAHQDEIGSANGSASRTGGAPDRVKRVRQASVLSLRQGKRLRAKNEQVNWYAASAYGPKKVKSFWQEALDAEHERTQLPDSYDPYEDNPTNSQYGLIETALKNYTTSRSRLSSMVPVGV